MIVSVLFSPAKRIGFRLSLQFSEGDWIPRALEIPGQTPLALAQKNKMKVPWVPRFWDLKTLDMTPKLTAGTPKWRWMEDEFSFSFRGDFQVP